MRNWEFKDQQLQITSGTATLNQKDRYQMNKSLKYTNHIKRTSFKIMHLHSWPTLVFDAV